MNRHTGEIINLTVRTSEKTRILAIPGSLRVESYNRRLLEAARELAPADVDVEVWDGLKRVPPFDEDDEGDPGAAVLELREAITQADAVVIATPEYNASLPGQLKNALDWASRPRRSNVLRGKPVAVIGAGPRPLAAVHGVTAARVVLGAIGARVTRRRARGRPGQRAVRRPRTPDHARAPSRSEKAARRVGRRHARHHARRRRIDTGSRLSGASRAARRWSTTGGRPTSPSAPEKIRQS